MERHHTILLRGSFVLLLMGAGLYALFGFPQAPGVLGAEPVQEDWPQFLGPYHNGKSKETGLLKEWPAGGPPLVWQMNIGTGYSAPSVLGDRLVLHHRQGDDEVVDCLHPATGAALWTYKYGSQFTDPYGYNNGPRCSPLLHKNHCYTLGAEGKLLCLNLETGAVVWQRDLQTDFNIPAGFFGVGASPILEGDKLIVLVGGQPNSGVVAFDPQTGKTLWQAVGKQTWEGVKDDTGEAYEWTGTEMVVSYASPIVATIHGQRHLLCLMRQGLVSLDPETGKERFKYWFKARVHESVNAACPVVVDDTIMISAAYRVGSALLKVSPEGNSVTEVWRDARNLLTHWSTAIEVDGHFYGFSGRHEQEGELRCIKRATGEVVWSTDGWGKPTDGLTVRQSTGEIVDRATDKVIPFPYYGRGSAILVEGRFIVLSERGTLALVEATHTGWKEISRCTAPRMKNPCWAAPVLSHGRLYLRCEEALVCLNLRPTQQVQPQPKS
ncbi:MAG: PQQ-binding-like beta-propeller repeat protein [Planctomycetaceae bacterium]